MIQFDLFTSAVCAQLRWLIIVKVSSALAQQSDKNNVACHLISILLLLEHSFICFLIINLFFTTFFACCVKGVTKQ